jgi:hypothetical protein
MGGMGGGSEKAIRKWAQWRRGEWVWEWEEAERRVGLIGVQLGEYIWAQWWAKRKGNGRRGRTRMGNWGIASRLGRRPAGRKKRRLRKTAGPVVIGIIIDRLAGHQMAVIIIVRERGNGNKWKWKGHKRSGKKWEIKNLAILVLFLGGIWWKEWGD